MEYPARKEDSHKGQNGKVGVIGGSRDFTGAPALSAKAALRTGCDLTRILTSEQVKNVVAGYSENFIVNGYPSGYLERSGIEKAFEVIRWSDVTVIGSGLGNPDPEVIEKIVSKVETPVVIDADAIKPALDADISDAVFTPHRGELEYIEDQFGSVEEFVDDKSVTVVVKGETDKVYTPKEVHSIRSGDSTMTAGGTGDVLTGVIASLISQGVELEGAAVKAVEINGRAGERAAEKYGKGALATDMIDEIPDVLN